MSGRILQFERHRHAESLRLLPWLVNGTLADDELAWVDQHVAGCSECRRECDAERALQASVSNAEAEDVHRHEDGADAGWQRMRLRLRAPGAQARQQWPRRARWLGWAVAAQALLIGLLGAALWQSTPSPMVYRTLGAPPAASSGNLVVVFDPHLDEAHLRRLLMASEARLIDGPNAAGAYVIAVPPRRLLAVRDALRAAPGVTLVATLDPEPGR